MQHIWLGGGGHTQALTQTMKPKHRLGHTGQTHTYSKHLEPRSLAVFFSFFFLSPSYQATSSPTPPETHSVTHTHNNKMFCHCKCHSPAPLPLSAGIFWILIGHLRERHCNTLCRFSDLQSRCYYETSTSDE